MKILKVFMNNCCCDRCGPGRVETYEEEDMGLDPKTLINNYEYRKYSWQSCDDLDEAEHFENVGKCLDGTVVVNDGDSEPADKKDYELFLREAEENRQEYCSNLKFRRIA